MQQFHRLIFHHLSRINRITTRYQVQDKIIILIIVTVILTAYKI
jgi:hypothetical protein